MNEMHATLHVDGMTCTACEQRITRILLALEGVARVKARLQGGTVSVGYDEDTVTLAAIKEAVAKAGYTVRDGKAGMPWVSLGIGLLLVGLYLAAGAAGLFTALPRLDTSAGYAALLAVGLLTSVHCVAMCGGIALAQSLNGGGKMPAGSGGAAFFTRMLPGLRYNAGRILSYTVVGGIAGYAGSAFNFSSAAKSIIMGVAGLLMVLFALRTLGVLRFKFNFIRLVPPRIRNAGPFAVGMLNVLIPCGPLQSMQLYALGTGSPAGGALSMFLFSAGTVPLLLLFGSGAALLPRKAVPAMLKASAVMVMFLGAVTFARAAAFSGIVPGMSGRLSAPTAAATEVPAAVPVAERKKAVSNAPVSTVADGVQTVVTDFKNGSYIPFSVKAGIPLKWTIRIRAEDLTGCNDTLIVPAYGINKPLVPGDNLVEFTPGGSGIIPYSCWMGMIRSRITVTEN